MMLKTEVPYASVIEQASVRRGPLPAYAPKSPAAQIYASLWQEIDARLESAYGRGQPPAGSSDDDA
jgi:cellulose biosynthesis protein BcsQ